MRKITKEFDYEFKKKKMMMKMDPNQKERWTKKDDDDDDNDVDEDEWGTQDTQTPSRKWMMQITIFRRYVNLIERGENDHYNEKRIS